VTQHENKASGTPKKRRTIIEPFKIKVVEPLPLPTREQREIVMKKAGFNLFLVKADDVTFDFLTDSGTSAMSANQWGAIMTGDESYAGSRSFFRFKDTITNITGYEHVIPTHQGRAGENLMFSYLVKKGLKVPSNNHFDTTRANIEQLGGEAVDLVIDEGRDPQSTHPFKGNIDTKKLDAFCREYKDQIPCGMITITNNTGGGQPVSLENIKQVSEIYKRYKIPFLIDACRFAENSYFIKLREDGFQKISAREIAKKTFSYADGCMVSAKKDGFGNIGGFIALKDDRWVEPLRNRLILTEGFPTYGGLAGRDLEALAVGLDEVLDENYLEYRLAVSRYMGEGLNKIGIPTVQPPGGHAIYIDARAFLPHVPPSQFPGQSLVCEFYKEVGIRSVEIGSVMFGKFEGEPGSKDRKFSPAALELVRWAFPRRVYTQSHFDFILEGLDEIASRRDKIKGMRMTYEPPFLKHFTARFEPV